VPIGSRAAEILAVLLREPGSLVSKDTLMAAVWPGIAVEPNNLTVQMAALRRVLDNGNPGESYIQTVPGRGYRLIGPVEHVDGVSPPVIEIEQVDSPPTRPKPPLSAALAGSDHRLVAPGTKADWRSAAVALSCVLIIALLTGLYCYRRTPPVPPRNSFVVMPFENFTAGHDKDYVAAAITSNLTSDFPTRYFALASQDTVRPLADQKLTGGEIGQKLGVRYVVDGNIQILDTTLRVNVELVSTETFARMWADRFDVPIADLAGAQDAAVQRLHDSLEKQITAFEAARSLRERPDNPDSLDLVIRAYALRLQPPSPERAQTLRTLLEHAVKLDPASGLAKSFLADARMNDAEETPRDLKAVRESTTALMQSLRESRLNSEWDMLLNVRWLGWQYHRCPETIEAAREFIALYPRVAQVYRWLGDCKTRNGLAQEALPDLQTAITLDDGRGWQSHNYRNMQYATLLLGRYDESIVWGERALTANSLDSNWERGRITLRLAVAHALAGRLDTAKMTMAAARKLLPSMTVRAYTPAESPSPVYAEQIGRFRDGLRLAGMRDHADEDADFGIPADNRLHDLAGPTPLSVPGATTIRSDELIRLIADRHPVVIDCLGWFNGKSIPGAIGLRYLCGPGDLNDLTQSHLQTKMLSLTNGDLRAPVVAVGWDSESFGGRNLAVRLVALGYTHVYWYRGGREAWEVRELPEANLVPQDW
jgi:adenylate cyclase